MRLFACSAGGIVSIGGAISVTLSKSIPLKYGCCLSIWKPSGPAPIRASGSIYRSLSIRSFASSEMSSGMVKSRSTILVKVKFSVLPSKG